MVDAPGALTQAAEKGCTSIKEKKKIKNIYSYTPPYIVIKFKCIVQVKSTLLAYCDHAEASISNASHTPESHPSTLLWLLRESFEPLSILRTPDY